MDYMPFNLGFLSKNILNLQSSCWMVFQLYLKSSGHTVTIYLVILLITLYLTNNMVQNLFFQGFFYVNLGWHNSNRYRRCSNCFQWCWNAEAKITWKITNQGYDKKIKQKKFRRSPSSLCWKPHSRLWETSKTFPLIKNFR